MKKCLRAKKKMLFTLTAISLVFTNLSSAITPTELPASVMPENVSNNLTTQPSYTPAGKGPLPARPMEQLPNPFGKQAEKIKFRLNKIILKGNHVYTTKQLEPLYKNKLHKKITIAQFQKIVDSITNYYRNNGYILTNVIVPPQKAKNGVVHLQIVEGYIDKVTVVGDAKGARPLVLAYGERIAEKRPLRAKNMEYYLLIANEIPGVQVKSIITPSRDKPGAADLTLVAHTKTFTGYLSYDNYGTRYLGPTEGSLGTEIESTFLPGDSIQFNYLNTTRGQELRFGQLLYSMPLGTYGTRLMFSDSQAFTNPGFVLQPLTVSGIAKTYYAMLQYPMVRTRTQSLTPDISFNYADSIVDQFQPITLLYIDHLRTIRFGFNYALTDAFGGSNTAALHMENGLQMMGATPVSFSTSGFTSRYGGSGNFAKFDTQLTRLQQLGNTRFAAYLQINGQYAMEPLLAYEQFAFGGAQMALGRGYDAAEIIGDRGLAGSLELRMSVSPGWRLLQAVQFYAFYDAGVIWNAKNVVNQYKKQSAISAGGGARLSFTKNFSGNLMIAQPITKPVAALALIGDGKQPRVFFSVTASV
jgi:hemolysin activation/secretion protein